MATNNTLNVRGFVNLGDVLITSGFVRIQNTNRPTLVQVVEIGRWDDGSTADGIYDIWFRALSEADIVCADGDILEVGVYNSTVSLAELQAQTVSSAINPMFPLKLLPVLSIEQVTTGLVDYNIQGAENELPGLPTIRRADNKQFSNNRTQDWIWVAPSDPDNDPIHFQVQWSKTGSYPSESANLLDSYTYSGFSYEASPDVWRPLTSGGLSREHYGKRCRVRVVLAEDGIYYWRVRATDRRLR